MKKTSLFKGNFFILLLSLLVISGFFAITPGIIIGQDDSQAPPNYFKKANDLFREAEKMSFNGQNKEALEKLKEASDMLQKHKEEKPKDASAQLLEGKCDKLKQNIEKKIRSDKEAKNVIIEQKEKIENPIPAGAAFRLKEIDTMLSKTDRILRPDYPNGKEEQALALDQAVQEAGAKMAEIEKNFGKEVEGAPQIIEKKKKIAELEAKAAALHVEAAAEKDGKQKKAADTKASSDEWLKKFNAYVGSVGSPDFNKEKHFSSSYTEDKKEMEKRISLYVELKTLYDDYKKNEPAQKTDELEQAVKNTEFALKSFDESKTQMFQFNLGKIGEQLKDAEEFIEKQKAANPPLVYSSDSIVQIRKMIDNAALSVPAGDPGIADANKRLESVIAANSEIKKKMIASITVSPEQYKGTESQAIRKKAIAVVMEKYPDSKIGKTSITSSDWSEESVIEYTDTTKTALQHRITRSVTVQAAIKTGEKCLLLTLDISQDKNSDGTWGGLKGHIMFTDEMLEQNIK